MTAPPPPPAGAGARRVAAYALLAACLVLDGFDVQAMGFVAPALLQDWGLPPAALAPVFGAGLLGLFLGSLLLGALADRVGRRPVLLGATLAFGLCTLLTARAGGLRELATWRLLAGLGLGAIMPNATALVGELAPPRRRVATMMIVTNGFLVGAMLGGFLAAWLVPLRGWRAVFTVGGAAPLLLLPALWRWLPESRAPQVGPRPGGAALGRLVRGPLLPITALLWLANFMNVLTAYVVASWLPAMLRQGGRPAATAVLAGSAVQAGGVVGTVVLGLALQRAGFTRLLPACFTLAAAALCFVASPGLAPAALAAVAFAAGWGIFGGQPGLNALAATRYPDDLRATGLGAALGMGRLGAVLGPVLAGALLSRGWDGEALFRVAALPALVAASAALALGPMRAPGEGPPG